MQNNQPQKQLTLNDKANGKSTRGFASMDKERHKLVSSKGGQTPREKNEEKEQKIRRGYEGF